MITAARKNFLRCLLLGLLFCGLSIPGAGQSMPLDHGWSLLVDRDGKLQVSTLPAPGTSSWRPVRVGLSWNAQFEDLRDYMGVAWYRTQVEIPQTAAPRAVLLRFGAVDNIAEVFVNGRRAGSHEGGYTPFVIDATRFVKPGRNDIGVRVFDPPMLPVKEGTPLSLYDQTPHGKQNWYVQTGGIWQPVTLEIRPLPYITTLRVTPNVSGAVKLELAVKGGAATRARVAVRSNSGATAFEREVAITGSKASIDFTVPNPELWSPESPALYTVEAVLANGDSHRDRFGFRSFEARDGKLFLNGKPYYMRAALDQDFYPDTIYTPPSKAYVADMILKAKALGLNMLRCHIKVCDPQYLDAADESGMLVWYEVPSWNDRNRGDVFTPGAAERGERIFHAMFERDWNRPSIVIASIINESWGADLRNANQREWLKAAFGRAKRMLGDRALVVDNSACCDNFHLQSDLDDFHQYFSIPDNAHRWDEWVAEFAARPKWSYSQHGDAVRTGREPLLVSEFGNWGLPELPRELPWWFDRDFGGREVTRPAGVLDRFRDFKYSRLFPDFNALAVATQWHQYRSLKHEIEAMRRHESIQGYVITELTDINWEVNGLMDMWRKPKAYAAKLAQIQQDNILLLRPERRSYRSGEQARVDVQLSTYAPLDLEGAQIVFSTSSGDAANAQVGTVPVKVANPAPGTVTAIASTGFAVPEVSTPRIELVTFELLSRTGTVLARNEVELYLFPKAAQRAPVAMAIHDPANAFAKLAPALARSEGPAGGLMLASAWDTTVQRHVEAGGRALLVLNSKDAITAPAPFKITPRAGSDLDGNWVTNFNWVLPEAAPFKGVAMRPLLGFEAAAVAPEFILQGIAPADYDKVLAGIFYGWLNNNSALAVRLPVGKGEVLATTFRFDRYADDPFARALLDSMIDSLAARQSQAAAVR